jgi:ferredoxin
MRVEVDMELCQSNGLCCISAPDVFELGDDDILRYEPAPDESLRDAVEEAERGCPVQAITVIND